MVGVNWVRLREGENGPDDRSAVVILLMLKPWAKMHTIVRRWQTIPYKSTTDGMTSTMTSSVSS